jgi:hypothetical protein
VESGCKVKRIFLLLLFISLSNISLAQQPTAPEDLFVTPGERYVGLVLADPGNPEVQESIGKINNLPQGSSQFKIPATSESLPKPSTKIVKSPSFRMDYYPDQKTSSGNSLIEKELSGYTVINPTKENGDPISHAQKQKPSSPVVMK